MPNFVQNSSTWKIVQRCWIKMNNQSSRMETDSSTKWNPSFANNFRENGTTALLSFKLNLFHAPPCCRANDERLNKTTATSAKCMPHRIENFLEASASGDEVITPFGDKRFWVYRKFECQRGGKRSRKKFFSPKWSVCNQSFLRENDETVVYCWQLPISVELSEDLSRVKMQLSMCHSAVGKLETFNSGWICWGRLGSKRFPVWTKWEMVGGQNKYGRKYYYRLWNSFGSAIRLHFW